MATVSMLKEFTENDDFVIFEERFVQYCIANKIEDDRRVPILLSLINRHIQIDARLVLSFETEGQNL